jgi:hypothetical protein
MADVAIEAGGGAAGVSDAAGEGDAAGRPWEDAPAAGGVMAGVLASFSEHGFDLGYRRAVSDAIALLLLTAAEHRRELGDDPQARALVAEFVDRLDRQLQRLSPTIADEVYGGLGI